MKHKILTIGSYLSRLLVIPRTTIIKEAFTRTLDLNDSDEIYESYCV